MRKSNEQTLGEIINDLIEQYRLKGKLNSVKVINSWHEVVGDMIHKHTKNLYIKNRRLYISVDSAALKNELSFARTQIIEALNEKAGTEAITDLVFQ